MPARNNPAKRLALNVTGLMISIIPVTVSIFSYFPIWAKREDASLLSGISLLLLLAALVPFYKHVRHFLKSPSAPLMWFFSFVIFRLLSRIADEMTVISFVGFISNLIGATCFRLARKCESEDNNEGRT